MNPPLFIFKLCPSAAGFNAKVLADHNFELDSIISHQHPSQLSYGSEFRDPDLLEELLGQHPYWPRLKSILAEGAHFPLNEISSEEREADLIYHASRGNHKSASKNIEILRDIVREDVERGFAIPLPITALHFLKDASLVPLGCVQQSSVDPLGNRVVKYRMTHDQSFPGPSNKSVNSRVQHDKLPPIRYSFVLLRIIHYIVDLRRRHPTTRIYLCKFDIDAAYRRCTLSSRTAMESLTMFEDFLLLALRMTFGGSPNPALWGVISETTTDIGNSLLVNNEWNHTSLFDPISNSIEEPKPLDDSVPFHQARDLSISIPPNDAGKIDIFIDDFIGVAPGLGDVPSRVCRAIPLAIRMIARPASLQDIIPRKDIISIKKLQAEGRLEEVKTVLGWVIDTRSLLISLPVHKFQNWSNEIDDMLKAGKSNYKALESLLGRLNHVACILMPMRHFMGRLYRALWRAKAHTGWTKFMSSELEDLTLHKKFLLFANNGVSLNILTFRKPTIILRSDACEFGLGGYNVVSGKAWRWEIPPDLRNRTSINSLEFIACVISIWIEVIHQHVHPEDCLLSQTDNTTAAGWLKKSNFAEEKDEFIQLHTARKLATLVMETASCIYSQWFPGESNSISDSLSRDFNIDPTLLCHILSVQFPSQVPFGLSLLPLPNEIVSWVTSLLQSQQQTEPWSKEPQRSSFARGSAFRDIYSQSVSLTTHSSTASIEANDTRYSAPLGITSGRVDSILKSPSFSRLTQSEPPWIAWHRPSSWLCDLTHDSMPMASLPLFYNDSSVDISQLTPERNLR